MCNGIEYDFGQIRPPGGSTYFQSETSSNNAFYFGLEGTGLPKSIPGCAFQPGVNSDGNVGGLAVGSTLCFSTGKLASQQWYLNDTAGRSNQVITVLFTGGQQGLQTKLQVTCDVDQVQPLFPTVLPPQTDPSVLVIPVRSKFACNDSPTRPPSIDGLPYCPDVCSVDYGRCIAADYTPRQCLDFANKGFLCKSTTTLQKCDATGFLAKQPLCPGQMRFVSCMSCTPTCETPNPATCGGDCAPGCQCPPDTPIWDEAIASCVVQDDCPREGDCDQAIVKNYLGMAIADAFCPSRAQGAVCHPTCEHSVCVPRPSFEGRDKYAALCGQLDKTACGARPEPGSKTGWTHRCIWADPTSGEDPTFECNGGSWELTDPGSCPIGAGGSAGIVGPACRAVAASQCISQGACGVERGQCAVKVQSVADTCKFPCIGVESGSTENMVKCARCLYTSFASKNSSSEFDANDEMFGVPFGVVRAQANGSNVTGIQTCCGCLPSLFAQLPGGFIPADVLPTLMQSPCKMHDPLQDDDANMDDDEVHRAGLDLAPSFVADATGWLAAQISAMANCVYTAFSY